MAGEKAVKYNEQVIEEVVAQVIKEVMKQRGVEQTTQGKKEDYSDAK